MAQRTHTEHHIGAIGIIADIKACNPQIARLGSIRDDPKVAEGN
jgi:hypothetical protein